MSTRLATSAEHTDRALQDDDIARAVMYTVSQPPHLDINEILIRPTAQQG